MMRWTWKRWLWAVALGTAAAASPSLRADELPKAGETITLKFSGQPDRIVTVVKATKKKDGSVETEVKDPKSGETFTLVDQPPDEVPAKPAAKPSPPQPSVKPPIPAVPSIPSPLPAAPALSVKPTVPAVPSIPSPLPAAPVLSVKPPAPVAPRTPAPARPPLVMTFAELPSAPSNPAPASKAPSAMITPMPALTEPPREKRFFSRLFSRDPAPASAAAFAPSPSTIVAPPAPEENMKRPFFSRLFGSKKAMPAAPPTMPAMNVPAPGIASTPRFNPSAEPPQAMPPRAYATPPAAPGRADPVLPTPIVPSTPAPFIVPGPATIPAPLPNKPAAPAVPAIPTIPIPMPMSQRPAPVMPAVAVGPAAAANRVHTVGYVAPIESQLPAEIQPFATTLRDALPPSHRMTAAKGLAEGRYGSTDTVKGVLFHAAKHDPCPAVRACCIEHLCKLGYYDPAFIAHIKMASGSRHEEVRIAAQAAVEKMSPK